MSGAISTCDATFLTNPIGDVNYTLGDPPKVVEFDKISLSNCPFKLEAYDMSDPENPTILDPDLFSLT